jgi:DNA-binding NarL/FixJ family response regulator
MATTDAETLLGSTDQPDVWEQVLAAEEVERMAAAQLLDLDAAAAVCRAAGEPMRRRAGLRPAGLSEREVEVLRLLARGLTKRQIAARLFLSPSSVNTHVTHIYSKVGVSTRAAVALFAMEHGLALP